MDLNRTTARRIAGLLLLLHALGHALPGMRVLDVVAGTTGAPPAPTLSILIVASIFALTMAALVASALGLLGVRPFVRFPGPLAAAGLTASVLLLVALRPPSAWIGVMLTALFVVALFQQGLATDPPPAPAPGRRLRMRDALGVLFVGYVAFIGMVRPWHQRWGSTEKELRAPLPGDRFAPGDATYGIQHAVTVHAPAERVWPWIAQIGQDRAGFYSYAFLENLAGLHLRNADRIHAEWQDIEERQFVQATPVGWLGRDEPLGWRVPFADENRVMVVENWGAFILVPHDERTTRFIIRTRTNTPLRGWHLAVAPLSLLLLEPVHFVMERRMMLGIKERVEATAQRAESTSP
ncbi:MAG TPA: hypothetical protein VK936_07150 [Longimicrobiales bacterium]|nr:hypothetical protein [Longimicrobiales bacterium]